MEKHLGVKLNLGAISASRKFYSSDPSTRSVRVVTPKITGKVKTGRIVTKSSLETEDIFASEDCGNTEISCMSNGRPCQTKKEEKLSRREYLARNNHKKRSPEGNSKDTNKQITISRKSKERKAVKENGIQNILVEEDKDLNQWYDAERRKAIKAKHQAHQIDK